jgi:hypothetical protein
MTVPRRLVPFLLVAAAAAGVWAGLQAWAFFAGT